MKRRHNHGATRAQIAACKDGTSLERLANQYGYPLGWVLRVIQARVLRRAW